VVDPGTNSDRTVVGEVAELVVVVAIVVTASEPAPQAAKSRPVAMTITVAALPLMGLRRSGTRRGS
jgi:hypothetical protein